MPLVEATEGLELEGGRIHLTPHDRSLLVSDLGFVSGCEAHGDRRWHRFADLLMTEAAQAFGARLVAVVLSGALDGGARGIQAVKVNGGRVLVQDPLSAAAQSMPRAALATGCADFALPPESLGDALVALCAAPGAADLFRVGVKRAATLAVTRPICQPAHGF
jgi:two-component system chemotaxis response regulator CheB